MVSNSVLRENARAQLGERVFGDKWLTMVAVYLVYSAIISVAGGIGFGLAAIVVIGPLTYGFTRILIHQAKGKEKVDFADLFCGFKECFANSIILTLMTVLFTSLWTLLFVVPGIVKSYSYAMAPYILHDDPEKDWETCIGESQAMMDGNKGQLFALDMSFLGWYFVGALCLGIGTLFVAPYHMQARANFYLALTASKEQPELDVEV